MEIIVASANLFRRELSCYILSEAGYTVHEVSDSTTLHTCLHHTHSQLLLLDAPLIACHTDDTCRLLQEHHLPVLIITSTSPTPNGAALPFADCDSLTWPYQADDLLAHVHALIDTNTGMLCEA